MRSFDGELISNSAISCRLVEVRDCSNEQVTYKQMLIFTVKSRTTWHIPQDVAEAPASLCQRVRLPAQRPPLDTKHQMVEVVRGVDGKRLTYEDLINS